MKQLILILLATIFSVLSVFGQDLSLKEKALEEFKKEHYDEAINYLEQALKISPDDAEIYYYLGFFNHYRAYDSRPLNGYDYSYSEKIFEYLDKAIELNPDYGDAKYFYGAECSGNAFLSMQSYNLEKLQYYYKLAYDKGAYPDWLIELGKNILNYCDANAIFFTGGNADFDICSYLQLHQNYRTDITVIPIGNIDRPWYVKFLKHGLKGGVRAINLNLTESQIYDIHPFKWDTTSITIPVSKSTLDEYGVLLNYKMNWTVVPDLSSERKHSKIEGEKVKNRTYLSPQRALLLQIVEDNYLNRPIYFSKFSNSFFFGGLEKFFKNCGLVFELTPIETKNTEFENDFLKIEQLLHADNFNKYSNIKENDIPRISGIVFSYHRLFLTLAEHYDSSGNKEKLKNLKELYSKYLVIGFNDKYEKLYQVELDKIEN